MPLEIRQFPCLQDNYGFLIRDRASGKVACVDTPDADAILRELDASGWGRLELILNTHWHPDHAGGNARLKEATGCEIVGPEEVTRIAPLDRRVGDGDTVMLGETRLEVLATPGHTLGHIVYFSPADSVAFVGDTVFAMGCGRLFEGTAEQMWDSLGRLAGLADDVRLYCAHEYTAANARFALAVDDAPAVRERAEAVFAARERGEPTVPTTVGQEKATNPFLRARDAHDFAERRAAKDTFKG
ncbi:hydroxyacylglutathione hydrolase [Caulobacter sp. 17J65-9]|uniref:hydroxyacylglutathione hydrolase n=1 Tax=Caulobacter sp. 17J65-9 TaxID=2709382 RepID=UPI0013C81CC5|nr:hydroxyacylglutathione hydrolase [Caulobacter sp. 17J65-9]NEX92162.1 hydroxyacylglutathione hydrolase [Caulobacter sp. 17J65-9]